MDNAKKLKLKVIIRFIESSEAHGLVRRNFEKMTGLSRALAAALWNQQHRRDESAS
jgi:hypothetical protein